MWISFSRRHAILGAMTVGALTLTGVSAVAADDISTQSDEILAQSALDERRGDNGTTPIAVQLQGNVYGARVTPYPYQADETAITGTAYYVDCSAGNTAEGSAPATDADIHATADSTSPAAVENSEETGIASETAGTDEIADSATSTDSTAADTPASATATGTRDNPFTSLDAANALQLKAGDAVLFKGGSTCTGTFQPQGSGTPDAPITINAYDASADNRARIDANGASEAMLVNNVEHYVIRNLELTNTAGNDTDYNALRYGLRVVNRDQGTLTGFDIANLYVHDVLGNNQKNAAGIRFEVLGSAVKSKFSEVEIAYNELRHVNRTGIVAATDWWQREEAEYWGGQFYAQDPIQIHDNFLTDIGGDGIVVWAAPDSIIEYNTLENAANEHGGKSDNSHNAGIWSWVTDRVIFRNNHVFDMHRANDNNDGAAFDADTGGTGQVFEHNLTHDNAGGFIMYCGCWGLSTNITARYNISINDGRFVDMVPKAEATGETARTVFMAGSTDSHFYNNTVLLPPTDVNIAGYGHYMDNNVTMANNLYLAQQGTVVSDTTTGTALNTLTWRNNVFAGPATGWPSAGSGNQVLPNLGLADGTGLARLQIRESPVLATGYPVADPYKETTVTDFLGNPVPTVTAPDVGAFQYSELPEQVALADGGFEDCNSTAWGADALTVATGQRSGAKALSVDGTTVSQVAPAVINRTYRIVAAVQGTSEAAELPQVSVILPSGSSTQLTPQITADGQPVADAAGWIPVSAVFRTAADATTFIVQISGQGLVDDISASGVEDLMVDGAFEAPTNTVWQPAITLMGTPANAAENGSLDRSEDAVTGNYAAPVPATGTRLNADWAQEPFSGDAYNRFTYVTPGEDYELGVWAKAKSDAKVTLAWEEFTGWRADYPLTLTAVKDSVSTDSTEYVRLSLPLNTKQEQIVVACQGEGLCDDMTLVAAWDGSVPAIAAESCAGSSTGSDSEINTDNESDSDHKTDSGNGAGTNPKDDIAEDENTGSDENLTPENQSSDKSDLASQTTTADGKELSQTGSSAASFALLGFALFALGLCAVLGSRQRRK